MATTTKYNVQHGDPNYNAIKFHSKPKITQKMKQMAELRQKEVTAQFEAERIEKDKNTISQPVEVYRRWKRNLKSTLEELTESGLTEAETFQLNEEISQLEYKIKLWESKNTPA